MLLRVFCLMWLLVGAVIVSARLSGVCQDGVCIMVNTSCTNGECVLSVPAPNGTIISWNETADTMTLVIPNGTIVNASTYFDPTVAPKKDVICHTDRYCDGGRPDCPHDPPESKKTKELTARHILSETFDVTVILLAVLLITYKIFSFFLAE